MMAPAETGPGPEENETSAQGIDMQAAAPRRRGLVFGTSTSFVGQVAGVGSTALTGVVVARLLGPSGTGTYALLANLTAALILFAGLGLATGITLEVGRGSWSLASALRGTQLAAIPLGLGGALLGLCFYAVTSGGVFKGVGYGLVAAPLISVPFGLAGAFAGAIAVARRLYSKYAFIALSNPLLTLIGVAALTIPWGLTGAVVGSAVGTILSAGIAVYLLYVDRDHAHGSPLDVAQSHRARPHLRRAFSLGVRGWGGDLLQFLNYRLDLFVVAAYASRGSVGQYSVALSLTGLGWLLPNAIASVFMPRVASLDAAAARNEVSQQTASDASARMVRHSVLIEIPTVLILSAILVLLLPVLFGAQFRPAIDLGFLLLPGVVALGVGKVISAAVIGRGHTIYSLYSALLTAPPTVLLYFFLIPRWGATGGAIASSISYGLSTAMSIYFFRRASVAPLRAALVPRRSELDDYRKLARQAMHSLLVRAGRRDHNGSTA
jgi:O-antigen/teichoic acid export membrane protein